MADEIFSASCVQIDLGDTPAYTFSMTVRQLTYIYYVAVRGRDEEEGAVQRPLNPRRIENITNYILDGNTFFNSFILNWTAKSGLVSLKKGNISFPLRAKSAQAIDGQHRLAGLEKAMEADPSVSDRNIIVTLCVGLSTEDAARIFLNINTEQKPVPRSLIFDLFGLTNDDPAHSVNRATDIAHQLNDEEDSPLHNLIKFPGALRGAGKIELSTFVSALKGLLEKDGIFSKAKLKSLDHQKTVIFNYFTAIKQSYVRAGLWNSTAKNPFLRAAGFNGAVDFLGDRLINECATRGQFTVQSMLEVMKLDGRALLTWEDIKGQDGKTARKNVADFLEQGLLQKIVRHDTYEF